MTKKQPGRLLHLAKSGNNLKVCAICKAAIPGVADALLAQEPDVPVEQQKIVGWAHEKCSREDLIHRLIEKNLEAAQRVAVADHLVASFLEAIGGSVHITMEHKSAAAAGKNEYRATKLPDGSWLIERPTLILKPTGRILPPPPGTVMPGG